MKVNHYEAIDQQPVEMEGSSGCAVRWLLGSKDGAPTFSMREFEVAVNGYTPRHHHDYEHEVFVLSGSGEVVEGETSHPIKAGDVIFVEPNDVHQFKNTGDSSLRFICLIPNSASGKQVTVAPECGIEPGS